ncbi:kinase-like protein [Teratosphaeria nubilosa]|uniref:non-specific serine/threonine protein kinase n=1 Tax=Teratosphaeria nubilosa TaxID=161662 RepID=A0A6G1LES9_9PEZI|nr:kinase-like protein [Teratosphaeria nubilosa]
MSRYYFPLSLEDVEDTDGYSPGGFHPVHLGDVYDDRYKIIHKLGSGGYSTTWLARDALAARYVALKINKASENESGAELSTHKRLVSIEFEHPGRAHVRSLLASFTITGPNGTEGPDRSAYCQKVAQALGFLHLNKIGHGDLTIPNILVKLQPMDGLTEEEIYERFGAPRKEILLTASKQAPGESAPRYIVEAAKVPAAQYLQDIFLIDLGVSFSFEDPPKAEDIGVPFMYRAPETMFDSKYDQCSDIWALGCILFEIRAGTPIFSRFMGTKEEIIRQLVQTKGKLPDAWWSRWDARLSYFDEGGEPLLSGPNGEAMANEYPLCEMIADIGEEDGAVGIDEERNEELRASQSIFEVPGTKVPEEEAVMLKDLLSKILQWNPRARLTAEQILQHPWLSSS